MLSCVPVLQTAKKQAKAELNLLAQMVRLLCPLTSMCADRCRFLLAGWRRPPGLVGRREACHCESLPGRCSQVRLLRRSRCPYLFNLEHFACSDEAKAKEDAKSADVIAFDAEVRIQLGLPNTHDPAVD
jgi:hypothetical protein